MVKLLGPFSVVGKRLSLVGARISATRETCPGLNDGSATITDLEDDGLFPPYSFLWSTGETTQTIENLAPGNLWVAVSGNNSAAPVNYTGRVRAPQPLQIIVAQMIPSSNSANASDGAIAIRAADALITFETGPISANNSLNVSNLAAGDYLVSTTDELNCIRNITVTVEQEPDPPRQGLAHILHEIREEAGGLLGYWPGSVTADDLE